MMPKRDLLVLLLGLLFGAPGCAAVAPEQSNASQQPINDAQQRAAIELFDRRRDELQFAAAQGRWSKGDLQGCRAAVEQLLSRNPTHRDGRLLFAELCLAEENPERGLEPVRSVVSEQPDDASAQHLLGTLLDATGHEAEALIHFERAALLSPGNELFSLSYQAASAVRADKAVATGIVPQ